VVAFVAAAFGTVTLAFGLLKRRPRLVAQAQRYVPVVFLGAVVAFAAMEWALVTHDFTLKYVAENNARETPMLYTIAGAWAALEGSILLWGLILTGYLMVVHHKFRKRRTDPLVGWATTVILAVTSFFFALMIGPANPFRTLTVAPANGRGPNPLLQNHPLMAVHPPILYLGYVGFTVPFAFAIAALVTGRIGEGWLLETRRWTLIAWGCLTLGIVLGAWWSYEVLGWGGYWGWDAVENASFLPWLTGTAYLHSVLVQERRGLLRVWNLSLLCATFSLTILGTFLTRSGVVQSVHAFSSSTIGPWLISLFAVVVFVSLGLIGWRGDRLRSAGSIDSPLSREGAFLANNLLFAGFTFIVLLGTVFPLLVEAWNGKRLSIGAPYFDTMTTPIGLVMLFLMAIAPVLPWRKASNELLATRLQWPLISAVVVLAVCVIGGLRGVEALLAFFLGAFAAGAAVRQLVLAARSARARKQSMLRALIGRANGGMIVHLGVIMIAVAIAASRTYGSSTVLTLEPGKPQTFKGHKVELVGVHTTYTIEDGKKVPHSYHADVRVDNGRIDSPALTQFAAQGQLIPTPSVRTGLTRDLYLTYDRRPRTDGAAAQIGFYIQPMTIWLWLGGLIMALGTILAIVPGRRRRPTDPTSGLPDMLEPSSIGTAATDSVDPAATGPEATGPAAVPTPVGAPA
jgi:cytochrome c-type biogenesis protein CcmF